MTAGAAALALHRSIDAEQWTDRTALLATAGTAVALFTVAAVALRFALTLDAWGSRIALCALPLGLLGIGAAFVGASYVDTSVALEAMIASDGTPSPAATVELGPSGRDVRLVGDLQAGVARRVADLLDAHPGVTRIHLTSEGGLADEGQALGDVIAAHELATFAPDYCVSACTLAFVRGRERLVLDDSRLGFHAPYEEGLFGTMYRGDASDQRAAYIAAGVAPDFVDTALKVDPTNIWIPTLPQLLAAHVVTAKVDHYQLPDSSLDGAATLAGARAQISRSFPLVSVFLKRSPKAIDAIAGWYLDAYRSERSEGETSDALRSIVHSAVAAGLARADDRTLLDVAQFLTGALAVAKSPADCARIARDVDLAAATKQLVMSDPHSIGAATALFDRAFNGHHVFLYPAQGSRAFAIAARGDVPNAATPETSCEQWRQRFASLLGTTSTIADLRTLVDADAFRSTVALRSFRAPLLHVARAVN